MGAATAGSATGITVQTDQDTVASAGAASGAITSKPVAVTFTIAVGDRIAAQTSVPVTLLFTTQTALAIGGKITLNYITSKKFINQNIDIWGINIFGYAFIFVIFFIGISSIYYFAPAIHKKLKFFNFGALFASILSILATNLFSFYLENFGSYNRLYGSIGTLIAIMVWIYLIALILILGFELNISFQSASYRSKEKTP
jgi:membrane protein